MRQGGIRQLLALVLLVGATSVAILTVPSAASARSKAPTKEDVAQCKDGSYSDNTNFKATCSSHDGVKRWISKYGRCKDGTVIRMSKSASCNGHNGFKRRLPKTYVPKPGWEDVARCNDGTYSDNSDFGKTCSGHRGVMRWLAPYARCKDGQVIKLRKSASCDSHGGFKGLAASDPGHPDLYPERPDRKREDQERKPGKDFVSISGYRAAVAALKFYPAISEFERDGYVVATVFIGNIDPAGQSYNLFDWSLQTPTGRVMSPTISTVDDALTAGALIKGGHTTGQVVFDVGNERGRFYLLYQPDILQSARGVWGVDV